MGFDSTFKRMWEKGRKIDPLTHKAIEKIVAQDSRNVRQIARAVGFTALEREADKNVNDPVRGIGRAALTAGVIFGGGALMSGAGGGAGGAGAASAGQGAGTASGVFNAAVDSQLANAGGSAVWGSAGGGMTGSTVATNAPAAVDLGSAGGVQETGLGSQGFSPQFQRLMSMRQQMPQQQEPPPPVRESDVQIEQPDLEAVYGVSSKGAKKSPDGGASQAIARGAAGADPLDTNGVQMAAIQALTRRTKALRDRINQLGQS